MIDPQGREYGRIEIRRVMNGTDTRYEVIWRAEVIGWATTPARRPSASIVRT